MTRKSNKINQNVSATFSTDSEMTNYPNDIFWSRKNIKPTYELQTSGSYRINNNRFAITKAFIPIIRMLKVCGVYTECRKTVVGRTHVGWCLFMTFGIWADMSRYFSVFSEHSHLSGRLMGLLAQGTFLIMNTFVASANFYSYSRYLKPFLREFDQYGAKYGFTFDIKKLRKVVRAAMWSLIVLSFLGLVGMSSLILKLVHNNPTTFTALSINPFQTYPERYHVFLVIMTLSWRFFGIEVFMQSCLVYSITTYSLFKEYSSITRNLEETILKKSNRLPTSIETLRQQHEAVTKVLFVGNKLIQGTAFAIYTCGIPMICFVINGIVRAAFPMEDFVSLLGFLVCCSVGMLLNTAFGVVITSAAHSPLQHLFSIDLAHIETKVYHQIELFTIRLLGPPIGIDVYGLFVINKSVVLTLVGTDVTYSVIVLQL